MNIQTLDTVDGPLAVLEIPADTLMSEAQYEAELALCAALERPARAELVSAVETSNPEIFRHTYRAVLTRWEEDGPRLRGASQPSLFSAA
jgi:hypothetical protein